MCLVPVHTLVQVTKRIDVVKLAETHNTIYELVTDSDFAEPLKYYLVFTHHPELDGRDFAISSEHIIYNRYFLIIRLTGSYNSRNGPDAGMDQQAFQILECANCDLDWSTIQQIETKAQTGSDPKRD